MSDFSQLPANLPVPADDGGADHLPGLSVPHLTLLSTAGESVTPDQLGPGRTIIYIYR